MWSTVVIGTHPIEADQEVWLELNVDDVPLGRLPAYWLENKGVNSLWHVPIPPQDVERRLRYRSVAARRGEAEVHSPYQEVVVRPNLPEVRESTRAIGGSLEGLVGNRRMTAKVDSRGSTFDIFFPTVGMHREVRPAEGERLASRCHFRAVAGGLGLERRLDWFEDRLAWEARQSYERGTNLLRTDLEWRHGPIAVRILDFLAMGPSFPRTDGGTISTGQYLKRFRIVNRGEEPRRAIFGLYVHAEVNGGIGDPGLSWDDESRVLLAFNRGHGHVNRKLARDATVEFGIALDERGEVRCEIVGPNEAVLLRWVELAAGGSVDLDVLISGAYTGWRGDRGTFAHWLRPALAWFRSGRVDDLESEARAGWAGFLEPVPRVVDSGVGAGYGEVLERSVLAAGLHVDAHWGSIAGGYDRGLNAYCWPRKALLTAAALGRCGHLEVGRRLFEWLAEVRRHNRAFQFWFQKYTMDGYPEWETPAVDQTAMVPWAVWRHWSRAGDRGLLEVMWPAVEAAADAILGQGRHPGLRWIEELSLVSSAGIWTNRFGAFLYSNAAVVAGLRAAVRIGRVLDRTERLEIWSRAAERIWDVGILGEARKDGSGPGLFDPERGHFLEGRRICRLRGMWSDRKEDLVERSTAVDMSMLGLTVPFGLLGAADSRIRRTARELLARNALRDDANAFAMWRPDPRVNDVGVSPGEAYQHDSMSLATLWMARYLFELARETGEVEPLVRGLGLLDEVIARRGPLGLSVAAGRSGVRRAEAVVTAGVWELHAMQIDSILDLHGMEHDVTEGVIRLAPMLPPGRESMGLEQALLVGKVRYQLTRGRDGHPSRLEFESWLRGPARLEAEVWWPGLGDLQGVEVPEGLPRPSYDPVLKRLSWRLRLPEGHFAGRWQWPTGVEALSGRQG
jgi:hypothetical protein